MAAVGFIFIMNGRAKSTYTPPLLFSQEGGCMMMLMKAMVQHLKLGPNGKIRSEPSNCQTCSLAGVAVDAPLDDTSKMLVFNTLQKTSWNHAMNFTINSDLKHHFSALWSSVDGVMIHSLLAINRAL